MGEQGNSSSVRRAAMQHAVNVLAETIGTLNLTDRQAEVAKAVLRAGVRKLNLDDGWFRGAASLPLTPASTLDNTLSEKED